LERITGALVAWNEEIVMNPVDRESNVTQPLLMGGSATAQKVPEVLQYAEASS